MPNSGYNSSDDIQSLLQPFNILFELLLVTVLDTEKKILNGRWREKAITNVL